MCEPGDAGHEGDAAADAGSPGPCASGAAEQLVYALCVWADEGELARIHAAPNERSEIPATVTLGGERFDDVELELHGGSARTWPKKSYRLRFAEERPKYDFFGEGPERVERIVLQGAWVDRSFVRAKLVFDTLRELGALAPRVGYARVYLNGELHGLYQVIERVDEHFLERHGLSREGNLYKAESHAASFAHTNDPLAGFSERTHEDGKAEDLADLFRAVAETPGNHAAFEREVATRIDLADFDLWNQVMAYALNLDTFTKNYYLYHAPSAAGEGSAPFRVIHWDADTTFGLWWTGERYEAPDETWLYGERNKLAARMYEIPEYRKAYLARLGELLEGPLHPSRMAPRAEELLDALDEAARADLARWQPDASFADERAFLEEMIALRHRVLREALSGADEDDD